MFLLNAASVVASAFLVWSIERQFRGADEAEHEEHGGMAAGFRFLRRDRLLLLITIAWMTLVFGAGFGIVADRPVAEAFDTGSIGFGAILGMWGWARCSARSSPGA